MQAYISMKIETKMRSEVSEVKATFILQESLRVAEVSKSQVAGIVERAEWLV